MVSFLSDLAGIAAGFGNRVTGPKICTLPSDLLKASDWIPQLLNDVCLAS
jgi:hypothetical protein